MYKYTEVEEKALLNAGTLGIKRYILSLDNHVSVVEALTAFCKEKNIYAGKISGLGAVNSATFRFLDPATLKYVDKTFEEQMEITNLTGNISEKDGKPYLHLHITASRRDYTCIGGHLLDARINGACELFVEGYLLTSVGRYQDPETGLNLYKF
ncbi:MAG: DNA-binding protein [Bacteroidales bacterium]|nr:DNA-binding protein [Bacteroidales bacterium]